MVASKSVKYVSLWNNSRRKNIVIIGAVAALAILGGTVAIVLLVQNEDLAPKPACVDPIGLRAPSNTPMGSWAEAAVSCDAPQCAQIGRDIMKDGGKTADAAIGTLLCQGVFRAQSMGIGGGFLAIYYNRTEQKSYAIIAREHAPFEASQDMFAGDPSKAQKGPLAVAVPGELKGYKVLYEKFGGGVTWSRILQPTIDLCRAGVEVDDHTYNALKAEEARIRNDTGMTEVFINNKTDAIWQLGDKVKRLKLADTLEKIAQSDYENGDEFYLGEVAELLVQDLADLGGIITMDDMANYTADLEEPLVVNLTGGYKLHAMPPPGSGVLMAFIMRLLSEFELAPLRSSSTAEQVQTYHLIIEAFKHAYAKRTYMGDYLRDEEILDEVSGLISNLTLSDDYLDAIKGMISLNSTNNTHEYYGAEYYQQEDSGTSHMSLVGLDGDAVSVTSTVNLYFGAGIRSVQTGVILNDEMDDFSAPNITNYFGVPPSPNNFIKPRKRPLSSMTPAVITDKDGNVKLVVGAAGGTRITTATTLVAIRNLFFNETIKEAIDAPRFHHQLFPMEVTYECGIPRDILSGLRNLNHKVELTGSMAVTCGVARGNNNGRLFANADFRKQGSIAGLPEEL